MEVVFAQFLNNNFNLRHMEGYLAVAWDSGATPVVLLTKANLCENVAAKIAETESVAAGVDIVTTSVMEEAAPGLRPICSRERRWPLWVLPAWESPR